VARRFVDRERELAELERFWGSGRAECIPVTGRRRIGKTWLLEQFAAGKRVVYYRCQLKGTAEQLPQLGAALAELTGDSTLQMQPPATWPVVLLTLERLARDGRLLLVLDELPYWVARDESVPSILQNWWDERGRELDLLLVPCGSAVQMMEGLLTGPAPLAGCVTGRIVVRALDFRAAADLLEIERPEDAITAYGILGGVPLYLGFFRPDQTLRTNLLEAVVNPSARLYVEPQALFAAHHESFDAHVALRILQAVAQRNHRWSAIAEAAGISVSALQRPMERLIGDFGLIERVLPVTESRETRTYYTQYHLTDNFLRFWFRFVEPNQGHIEFGDRERIVDEILDTLAEYMGLPFEAMCRDWVRLASAAGALSERVGRVGSWWDAAHQVDVVGLDRTGRVAIAGECKWRNRPFNWDDLEQYLGNLAALGERVRPDITHVLFSKSGFAGRVETWAQQGRARLLSPSEMLGPFGAG
jgi:AAA+ ATPase superfamily predicted ATPase